VPEDEEVPEEIVALVNQRQEARKARNFAEADALRDKITALGYDLKDTPEGVKISKR
jgi:cysteinyl-tRNA synthetase